MKQFFLRHKKLHIWLLIDLAVLLAWLLCRGQRSWMNAFQSRVTAPLRAAVGRLCALTELPVMELLCLLLIGFAIGYLVFFAVRICRAEGRRRACLYDAVLGAADIALTVYALFCLLWGVNYWIDTFQERSGIYARPVEQTELLQVTQYFAGQLSDAADDVPRDGNSLFAVPRQEILDAAPTVYDALEREMPFLAFDDLPVKALHFSRTWSRMNFTGFYCPYTGESCLNVDCPACLLPSTVAHELGHRRGIASEQECNFLGVLASVTSGNPSYEYSGWLLGFLHLGNALCRVDPDAYAEICRSLPDAVFADLAYHNAYWRQFQDTAVQKVSHTAYDSLLKASGDSRGYQSYGAVVDLLVAYYHDLA